MTRIEIKHDDLASHNDLFWEHFTDHLMMVFSFLILGFLLTVKLCTYLLEHRIKIDYDLPKGKIIRVVHKNKIYYVIRPNGLISFIDVLLLLIFSRTSTPTSPIYYQEEKRIRRISVTLVVILILSIIWGVIMLFSALERDLNPFNHIELIFSLFE